MGRKRHRRKRSVGSVPRPDKGKRREIILYAFMILITVTGLLYMSIKALITGEGLFWENYRYQPVGPGHLLVAMGALAVGGVVYLWNRYVKRKPDVQTSDKRRRNRPWPPYKSYPW